MLTLLGAGQGQNSSFDADYQAVLNYATTQGYTLPSASQQIIQNQLVIDLKSAGVWNKLDTFANFATDGSLDFALIDWKRLSLYTAVNSPTFTINEGFTGDGTSSYIDTNFNPATSGVNYTQNNASRYIYTLNVVAFFDGIGLSQANRITASGTAQRINQGTGTINSAYSFSLGAGMKSIHRTSSTNVELFSDITQTSRTSNSFVIQSENQFISRSLNTYSANKVSMYAMGASLVAENTDFVNAFNTYLYNINNLDSDYVAVLDRAITLGYTLPTFSQIIKQNQLVIDLKAGGIWDKLDTFAVFATDGSSDFALIDWKRLTQYTAVNSPSFTTNRGFKGNGTSSYIDTNYIPSTIGNNYSVNDASFGYWCYSLFSSRGSRVNMGSRNSSVSGLTYAVGGGENSLFMNTNNITNGILSAISSNIGLRHFNRVSSSGASYYNSTGLVGSNTNVSFDLSNYSFFLFALNSAGSPLFFTLSDMSMAFAGADLSSENTALNNAFDTYLNSL
jgi:hypothetical protein